jgi:hypothetical protein
MSKFPFRDDKRLGNENDMLQKVAYAIVLAQTFVTPVRLSNLNCASPSPGSYAVSKKSGPSAVYPQVAIIYAPGWRKIEAHDMRASILCLFIFRTRLLWRGKDGNVHISALCRFSASKSGEFNEREVVTMC